MLKRITIGKTAINPVYKPYLNDKRFLQIFKGGASAGKSFFIAQKIVYLTKTLESFNTMVLREHGADNHDSTFAEVVKCIHKWHLVPYFKINESQGNERIKHIKSGNEIIFKGLDKQEEKRKGTTFKKGTLNCIWMDEITESREKEVTQLLIRLRGEEGEIKIFIGSFNPIDERHWIKKKWFDHPIPEDQGFTLETTYKHNLKLSQRDRDFLESFKDTDPYHYNVYCLGNWGTVRAGRILNNIVIHDYEIRKDILHLSGGDFGFNDPNTLMDSYVHDQELWICHEWVKNELEPEELKKQSREIDWIKGRRRVVCDNTEPGLIKMYNSPGRTFIAIPARKNVYAKNEKSYNKTMALYFKSFKKIHIHKTNCPIAAVEFTEWHWITNKKTDKLEDVPEDGNDHTIDGVKYSHEEKARRYFATNRR
jgi:phage terminase large subunit